jgi:PAS domain S-box-containing protein
LDLELCLPDGSTRWIVGRGEVEAWQDGKVASLRGTIQDITERKKNEQALALGEKRYRSLVRASAQIVWATNSEGASMGGSADWQAFTGQSAEEDLGFGWANAIHPEDREFAMRAWRDAVAGNTPYNVEYRIRRHDGVYRHVAVRAVPVHDDAGRIVEWVGTHTDISERVQTENALKTSESRFRKLFQSDLLGIGIPDRFGAFLEGNDELLRMVGYTRADLEAGMVRWDTMTPPEYQAIDASHIAEAAERGSCTPYEKEYIRKDGSRVPIACGYALLEGSEDTYIGFVQDLSRQKAAEKELREREERFRVLAESLPEFVWTRDAEGKYVYCNQRLLDYVGQSPEWLRNHAFEAVHPDDRAATSEHWKRSVERGETYLNAYRLRRHDGVYRHFLARAVPMRDETGQIQRWLGSTTDIHDQKLAEEALRRTEKINATAKLAASMAHEINNPLNSVVNALYLALNDETLSEETRGLLKLADQELKRSVQVATQMLRFHRQSTSRMNADLSEIMDGVLSLYGPRLNSHAIEVEREYVCEGKLHCFQDELRQVFANFISNSLDAMKSGGKLRIRIAPGRGWGSGSVRGIRVTIADNGEGIPPELQKAVFEPFVSTKADTGTGLGLWVSDGIIKNHKGTIAVRSSTDSERHGTVFSIFLPQEPVDR